MTVTEAFAKMVSNPADSLVRRWNWKSAIFSSVIRALIFFFCNLTAGWSAAIGAMLAELAYRGITAGFYGALTQLFRDVEPEWAATLAVVVLLPFFSHSVEILVHVLRGTPKLFTSIVTSVIFTMISTAFNQYAMRRGLLIVGQGAGPVSSDMRRIFPMIGSFLACGPLALYRWASRGMTGTEIENA
ncbi:MAG TPA: hypothetical protein VHZ07_22335 [Bryobacteraceae bacterium]|nr:hypothetical protein [Bryobacteraceae bacterium]